MKLFASIVLSVMCVSFLCAQNRSETTAEQEYLSNTESIMITELAAGTDRDTKLLALEYAQNAVNSGRVSPAVRQTLINLAGEGTLTVSTINGRIVNNFPEVRKQACDLLAQVPSVESKEALKKIVYVDDEPMVAAAAVRALTGMNVNDNDDSVDTIIFVHKKFSALNPTSSLADAVLDAYEKLASSVSSALIKQQMMQSIAEIAVNYNYVKPVRDKALSLLKALK